MSIIGRIIRIFIFIDESGEALFTEENPAEVIHT